MDRNEEIFVLAAVAGSDPGSYYVYDWPARRALEVGAIAPWLRDVKLADVIAFAVNVQNGSQVEAFLTRPDGVEGPPPLLVMPHGGPIGVRDDRDFDPVAQFLAYHGWAVLKVNYRGSSGYGRSFEGAGFGQWGSGIEDDIDAAITHVLERDWADASRIALFGASYGGYSALMSAIRHPGRFRCVATWMGVSDLPLLFASDAVRAFPMLRRFFERAVGDPENQLDDLIRRSPVYRAAEIDIPVLIVHGDRDTTVDIEHAHRLKLMLEKYGNTPEFVVMPGYGHWMPDQLAATRLFGRIRDFLARCVQP
jgi:dipeptidyl aminopeptidase/acylaminoacyl peptidase